MEPIRVLIADDHAVLREGVCALLSQHPDMCVVGQATNGVEALAQVEALKPDVVLMDISMPEMDGLEATRQIKARSPETRVLILNQHDSREYVLALMRAGAAGFILKKAGGAELLNAIRAVATEGAFLHPGASRVLIDQVDESAAQPARLSEREKQVLKMVADGKSNKEIAQELCLSAKTVMVHRTNIMAKLNLHSRTELVKYAIREGMTSV
jgi:DNA-binding NarL/FixJ family response regulator